jgi:hypothetical protein
MRMRAAAQTTTGGVEEAGRRFSWRTLGMVLTAATFTSLLLIPFSTTLLGQGGGAEIPTWMLVVGSLIQGAATAAIAGGLGLWLGPKVGLGAPDLRGILRRPPGRGSMPRATTHSPARWQPSARSC